MTAAPAKFSLASGTPYPANLPLVRTLTNREEFPQLLCELGLTGLGVEVGVQYGHFSAHLLRHWPGVLLSIDPWRNQPDYADLANSSPETQDETYRQALDNLAPWVFGQRRCVVIRDYGLAQAKRLPRAFDFVYLDARHDYESVAADLAAWAPLVKPGGILAGHDYLDGDFTFACAGDRQGTSVPTANPQVTRFGVKRAVDEAAAAGGWTVRVTTEADVVPGALAFPTWYTQLPA